MTTTRHLLWTLHYKRRLRTYRRVILNPLSHAEIVSIFRKEVEDTIQAVEKLDATLKAAPKKGGQLIVAASALSPSTTPSPSATPSGSSTNPSASTTTP